MHVKGLSKVVAACPKAEFWVSGVFNEKDALAFMCAYGNVTTVKQTGGAKELYASVKKARRCLVASQRCILFDSIINAIPVRVSAFSPTPEAQGRAVAHMAQYLPQTPSDAINHAPDVKPNIESVVVHIDFGDDAILLGADLEVQAGLGWEAIIDDGWCKSRTNASLYKVAHHGSITGEHIGIWGKLLCKQPISALTPFVNGKTRLPTQKDRKRIRKNSSSAYISSKPKQEERIDIDAAQRLSDICSDVETVNKGFGAVRFRKKRGEGDWNAELFGDAGIL